MRGLALAALLFAACSPSRNHADVVDASALVGPYLETVKASHYGRPPSSWIDKAVDELNERSAQLAKDRKRPAIKFSTGGARAWNVVLTADDTAQEIAMDAFDGDAGAPFLHTQTSVAEPPPPPVEEVFNPVPPPQANKPVDDKPAAPAKPTAPPPLPPGAAGPPGIQGPTR